MTKITALDKQFTLWIGQDGQPVHKRLSEMTAGEVYKPSIGITRKASACSAKPPTSRRTSLMTPCSVAKSRSTT
jgi:hypothetical protein